MTSNLHLGKLFEIGPDGYGYIIDKTAQGRTYAFYIKDLATPPPALKSPTALEGHSVSFRLSRNGRPRCLSLTD
jgi:hypothetical protein